MTTVNITVTNDADFYRAFRYTTVEGDPVDISNSTMEMMLRRHASDKVAVMRLATDTGEIVYIDPVNGRFTVKIVQEELERLGTGGFDQSNIMTNTAGDKIRIWSGTFTNNAGPTR